jgi:hypothetical protein
MKSWKAYPYYMLDKLLGSQTFKCNLDITKNPNINEFYWTIIKAWNDVNEINKLDMNVLDIRKQCLWLNKHIKINKVEIKWKNWIQHNILTLHNILDNNGNFLSIEEINREYNFRCDFMQYNSLKDAIPKEWREKVKTMNVCKEMIESNEILYIELNNQNIPIIYTTNKEIYWKIIEKIQIPHVTKDKWEKELGIDADCWPYYFQIPLIIRDTKIRSFQYKLIFNLIPCNLYLLKIGKSNTYNCNYCQEIDNISHYFYICENTNCFWDSFKNWWNRMEEDSIIIDKTTAILGIKCKGHKYDKLNACLQLARWHIYIYIEKLNLHEPALYKFLCMLKYKIKIEKIISSKNNNMSKFDKLWGEIEEYIE